MVSWYTRVAGAFCPSQFGSKDTWPTSRQLQQDLVSKPPNRTHRQDLLALPSTRPVIVEQLQETCFVRLEKLKKL